MDTVYKIRGKERRELKKELHVLKYTLDKFEGTFKISDDLHRMCGSKSKLSQDDRDCLKDRYLKRINKIETELKETI